MQENGVERSRLSASQGAIMIQSRRVTLPALTTALSQLGSPAVGESRTTHVSIVCPHSRLLPYQFVSISPVQNLPGTRVGVPGSFCTSLNKRDWYERNLEWREERSIALVLRVLVCFQPGPIEHPCHHQFALYAGEKCFILLILRDHRVITTEKRPWRLRSSIQGPKVSPTEVEASHRST